MENEKLAKTEQSEEELTYTPVIVETTEFVSSSSSKVETPHSEGFLEEAENLILSEISNYLSLVSFSPLLIQVDTSNEFLQDFAQKLFQKIEDSDDLLGKVNTPQFVDPLEKLEMIETTGIGELNDNPKLELILPYKLNQAINSELNPQGLSLIHI